MRQNKAVSLLGFAGMVLVHSNTIPAIYTAMMYGGNLPPLLMTLQTIAALLLLLIHASYNRFALYIAGNACGLVGQLAVLFLTLKG